MKKHLLGAIDAGASENFMSKSIVMKRRLNIPEEFGGSVCLADRNQRSKIGWQGYFYHHLGEGRRVCKGVSFALLNTPNCNAHSKYRFVCTFEAILG